MPGPTGAAATRPHPVLACKYEGTTMNVLVDLFLLRHTPYRHACESARAPVWLTGFIVAVGCAFGTLVAVFQRLTDAELEGIPVADIPDWVLLVGNIVPGMVIAVAVHAGIAIVAWLMVKGVSGRGHLVALYRATGYLLPLGLPALPLITSQTVLDATVDAGPVLPYMAAYAPLAGLGLCLFVIGLFQAIRVVEGLSIWRAACAVALFALFSFSILLFV